MVKNDLGPVNHRDADATHDDHSTTTELMCPPVPLDLTTPGNDILVCACG